MFHVLFQLFSVKRCYHLAFCNRLILNPLTKKQSINQFLLFYLICLIVLSCFYLSQWSCAQGVGWNWSTRRNPLGTGCFSSCGLDLCLLLRVERRQISWKGKYHPHVWSKSSSVRLQMIKSINSEGDKKIYSLHHCLLHGFNFPN